jgi:hypothetical protein
MLTNNHAVIHNKHNFNYCHFLKYFRGFFGYNFRAFCPILSGALLNVSWAWPPGLLAVRFSEFLPSVFSTG